MIKRLFICAILTCGWTTASAGFTPYQHAIGSLLTGERANDIAVGGEMLHSAQIEFAYNRQVDNERLFDLAAYILHRDMNDPDRSHATAWLARAIAQTGNTRYRKVVERAASKDSPRRLQGHAEAALSKFGDSEPADPFNPGLFDLSAMVKALAESDAGGPATAEGFAELKPADSLETTYATAGLPSSVNAHAEHVFDRYHRQTFQVNYHGIGVAWFDPDNVRKTYPTSPRYHDFDIERHPRLINQLFTGDGSLIRMAAKELAALDEPIPNEELDAITYVVWKGRNTTDKLKTDGLEWLCFIVNRTDNPRYQSAFEKIADQTTNKQLQARAERVLGLPSDPNVEQFDPESIDARTPGD